MNDSVYSALGRERPDDVVLGGAYITLVRPLPGRARTYNRWYEDDHTYAGAMMSPWVFAGRRFVATRELASAARPHRVDGCYLTVYWHVAGHARSIETWGITRLVESLVPQGRGNTDREHLYSAFHDHAFSHVVDSAPMRDIHALDHPYFRVVLELLDVESPGDRADCLAWLRTTLVPQLPPAGAGQCVVFTPRSVEGLPAGSGVLGPDDPARRICLLWFLRGPVQGLPEVIAEHEVALRDHTSARLALALPMAPTVPGTDAYVDLV